MQSPGSSIVNWNGGKTASLPDIPNLHRRCISIDEHHIPVSTARLHSRSSSADGAAIASIPAPVRGPASAGRNCGRNAYIIFGGGPVCALTATAAAMAPALALAAPAEDEAPLPVENVA